jgi:hypothetical protein
MSPGETLELAVSLAGDLGADTMTGETPEVSVWTKSGDTYTAASGFTVANEQVNTAELTAAGGETIAIGQAIVFLLTAGAAGTYYVRAECDATGAPPHVVTERVLIVSGAPAVA